MRFSRFWHNGIIASCVCSTALMGFSGSTLQATEPDSAGFSPVGFRYSLEEGRFIPQTQPTHDIHLRPSLADKLSPNLPGIFRPSMGTSLLHDISTVEEWQEDSGFRYTIAAVLRASDRLRASLHEANARHHGIGVARAKLLPTITASLSFSDSDLITGSTNTNTVTGLQSSSRIEVSVPIFSSGKHRYRTKSARAAARAADFEYLALEQQIAYEGVLAYLEIYLSRKREDAIHRNVAALRRIHRGLRAQYHAGFAGLTDLEIAAAELADMKEQLAEARGRRREAESAFESKTGLPAPIIHRRPRVEHNVPRTLRDALVRGLNGNARILSAVYTAQAARYNAKSVRGDYLPQVSLTGSYEHNRYYETQRRPGNDLTVGVRLTVPVVDFGAFPAIHQARETALAEEYRARDTKRAIEREIRSSWISYHSNRKRAAVQLRRVGHLKSAVYGTKKEFDAGFRPLSDLLRAQMDLTNARIKLAENEVAYLSAAYLMDISASKFQVSSLTD
ncbi:MAG: TolC family protein [Pseudomonadota bacterium]